MTFLGDEIRKPSSISVEGEITGADDKAAPVISSQSIKSTELLAPSDRSKWLDGMDEQLSNR